MPDKSSICLHFFKAPTRFSLSSTYLILEYYIKTWSTKDRMENFYLKQVNPVFLQPWGQSPSTWSKKCPNMELMDRRRKIIKDQKPWPFEGLKSFQVKKPERTEGCLFQMCVQTLQNNWHRMTCVYQTKDFFVEFYNYLAILTKERQYIFHFFKM